MKPDQAKVNSMVEWLCANCGNHDNGATMADMRESLNRINSVASEGGSGETYDSLHIEAAWEKFETIASRYGKDRFPKFDATQGVANLEHDGTFTYSC